MNSKGKRFQDLSKRDKQNYLTGVGNLYGDTVQPTLMKNVPRGTIKSPSREYPTEFQEQSALVKWSRTKNLPLMAIPNGGARSLWEGQRKRAEGLLIGASDLFLAMPSKGLSGFWIEMKARKRKPTYEQIAFMEQMRKNGYKAEYYDDWEKAKNAILEYLGEKKDS